MPHASAQQPALPIVDGRNGDTLWLAIEGIVEIWLEGEALEGTVTAWTDSTLTLSLVAGEADGSPMGELMVDKRSVEAIGYWKGHQEGKEFDAQAFMARRRRHDYMASGLGIAGAATAFLISPVAGAVIVFAAVSVHVVSTVVMNGQFKVYRFKRRWTLP
jgi:hypothetical protein